MTRTTFTVSRAAEFFSEKELQMQMGAGRSAWLPMLLKELIDNALDASEGAGALPCIEITATDDSISVSDNGPGIPANTVVGSLDYLSRTSSNNLYVSPTRGQLGNALKCLYAAGFVTHGRGLVEISSRGILHRITVGFDEIRQEPTLEHEQQPIAHNSGTVVKTTWPGAASELGGSDFPVLQFTTVHFGLFNPHATFYLNGEAWAQPLSASDLTFSKWKPNRSSPASWYYRHQFKQLLCAHLSAQPQMYVREFLKLFAGMSGSWAQAAVLESLKLQRTTITDAFTTGGEVADARVMAMHDSLVTYSGEQIKAKRLGVIGRDLLNRLANFGEVRPESTAYAKALVEDNCRPFVAECWFAAHSDPDARGRTLLLGINNSIVRTMPSDLIRDVLEDNLVDPYDPVTVAIHIACPGFDYVDRGKSRIDFADDHAGAITQVIEAACKKWKKVKARLRREERASERELDRLCKQTTVSVKEAAWAVMEQAYLKASGNGAYPANARQVMYAARGKIQELTGKPLSDQYFTQTLLPDFQAENCELTADWDVVYDNRGNLIEPHTNRVVPIGTVAVRDYVSSWCSPKIGAVNATVPISIRSSGPAGRYSAAIFIEKEGFNALFAKAQTAELFDVAIFSTKGMSTTAARQLVDRLSAEDVPIFLLHDFDQAGMTIARTIQADGRRYQFANELQVIDLGLRLEQAQAMELEPEEFYFPKRQKQDPRDNLVGCGATAEELAFLVQGQKGGGWYGQRIELNAMTAPQFVEFVHGQLEAHGSRKVVPDDNELAAAYQHVRHRDALLKKVEQLLQQAEMEAKVFTTPDDLEDQVRELIEGTTDSWEEAIKRLAREDC